MFSSFQLVKIQSTNLRNLGTDIFSFSSGVNCIVGKNGQGKTNLLEAIHLLCMHKSFRKKTSFPQLISIDSVKPEILISGVISESGDQKQLSTHITNQYIKQSINSKQQKKKQKYPTLFIGPFDFYRFNIEKEFRRNWFDTNMILIDGDYETSINRYGKYIKQRNRLLAKKPTMFEEQVASLDKIIIGQIKTIESKRSEFAKDMCPLCCESYKSFFDEAYNLSIEYSSTYGGLSEEEIKEKMSLSLEKDIILGFTRHGPHRENFNVLVDGFEIENYSSVGQQKMAYLSLIFAYISLFRYKCTSYPMVLIDDISGELDRERWQRFVSYFDKEDFQLIITTANKEFEKEIVKIENSNLINIDSGRVAQH